MKTLSILLYIGLCVSAVAETNTTFKMEFSRWDPTVRAGSVYNLTWLAD